MEVSSKPLAGLMSEAAEPTGRLAALDSVAMGASMLCLVHCLAMPVLIAALPGLAVVAGEGRVLHIVLLLLALPMSSFALIEGRRRGGPIKPVIVGMAGLAAMTAGVFVAAERTEMLATVAGGLLLIGAHLWNWRSRRGRRFAA